MTDDPPRRIVTRPERVMLPPSDEVDSYLLEIFELGDGPVGSGSRHAVWLYRLKAGGFRWKCSCGVKRDHRELDAALLADARSHFDEAWTSVPIPLGHPICLWNDRAVGDPPPTMADLEQLAYDLSGPPDELARRRTRKATLPLSAVSVCGLCGQPFRIASDDPHWSSGRGPICPNATEPP